MDRRELDAHLTDKSKNILFIFENDRARKLFKRYVNPASYCILITEDSSVVGLRYCQYKFLSSREVEDLVRWIEYEQNRD